MNLLGNAGEPLKNGPLGKSLTKLADEIGRYAVSDCSNDFASAISMAALDAANVMIRVLDDLGATE